MGPGGSSAELKGGMMLARDINKLRLTASEGLTQVGKGHRLWAGESAKGRGRGVARAKAELQSGHRNIRAHQVPALQWAPITHCLFLNAHNPGVPSVMLTGRRRSRPGGSGGLPEGWQAQLPAVRKRMLSWGPQDARGGRQGRGSLGGVYLPKEDTRVMPVMLQDGWKPLHPPRDPDRSHLLSKFGRAVLD